MEEGGKSKCQSTSVYFIAGFEDRKGLWAMGCQQPSEDEKDKETSSPEPPECNIAQQAPQF